MLKLLETMLKEIALIRELKPTIKGKGGEMGFSYAIKIRLDQAIYKSLENVTLPTADGSTQIDHIILSQYGIFVIELKTMKGWIFGNENDPTWTQVLYGGQKYKFQNPLRQNYKHTKTLAELLQVPHESLYSIVFFCDTVEFKTPMPKNVMNSGLVNFIHEKTQTLYSHEQVTQFIEKIEHTRMLNTAETDRQHTENLKRKFGTDQK